MSIWWSAIDTEHASYEELRHRKVVSQGWTELGNLSALTKLLPAHQDEFKGIVQLLGDVVYGGSDWWDRGDRKMSRAPQVMWNLLSVRAGDLVVAVEGTTVRGICQVGGDAVDSYLQQPHFGYGQTIGLPVEWEDWDQDVFGPPPTPASRGFLGVKRLRDQADRIKKAWGERG